MRSDAHKQSHLAYSAGMETVCNFGGKLVYLPWELVVARRLPTSSELQLPIVTKQITSDPGPHSSSVAWALEILSVRICGYVLECTAADTCFCRRNRRASRCLPCFQDAQRNSGPTESRCPAKETPAQKLALGAAVLVFIVDNLDCLRFYSCSLNSRPDAFGACRNPLNHSVKLLMDTCRIAILSLSARACASLWVVSNERQHVFLHRCDSDPSGSDLSGAQTLWGEETLRYRYSSRLFGRP